MRRHRVVLAPQAEDDIAGAFRWYRARSAPAADAFRTEVFDAIDRLADSAPSWPLMDGMRRRVLKRFPYAIWFNLDGDEVVVLAVAHHRRRPATSRS